MYLGLVKLGELLSGVVIVKNSSSTPIDSDSSPIYRVYGPTGLMLNGTGSLAFKDSGNITDATNASPIVITSAAHGLVTGVRVTVASVVGNTAANGTFIITRVNDNTFSLDGSTGNGAYVSGGTWHMSGVYDFSYTPTGGNGFESGENYSVVVSGAISATAWAEVYTFTVV